MQTLVMIAAVSGLFGHGGIFSGSGMLGGGCANGSCSISSGGAMVVPQTVQIAAPIPVQASSCYSSMAPVQGSSCYSAPAPGPAESSNYEFSKRAVSNPVIQAAPRPAKTRFASIRQQSKEKPERIPYAEPGPPPDAVIDVIKSVAPPTSLNFEFYHK